MSYARVRAALRAEADDPLLKWRHATEMARKSTRALGRYEIHQRAPNKIGKTEWGAAVTVSLLRRCKTLDSIPLPLMPPRPVANVFVRDREVQKLSCQPAVLRMLGSWPHVIGWQDRARDVVGTVRIKQEGGTSSAEDWSVLHFLTQENPDAGTGARGDVRWADEPPKEPIWRESRKMSHLGGVDIAFITDTPIKRSEWYWLKQDFDGCLDNPKNGRVEFNCSLYDSEILSPQEIRDLESKYAGDPYFRARMFGEYVDGEGEAAFDLPTLRDILLPQCNPGRREHVRITRQIDTVSGRRKLIQTVPLEVWTPRKFGHGYYIPVDGSAGIKGGDHDPGALWVVDDRLGDQEARYSGYIGGYGLGTLAASVGRQYATANVDPETTGGWGDAILTALGDVNYPRIAHEVVARRRWKTDPGLGFKTTPASRPKMIAIIQEWLLCWKRGMEVARVRSADSVRELMDIVLDSDDKAVAGEGYHDEEMILRGQSLLKCWKQGRGLRDKAKYAGMDSGMRAIMEMKDESERRPSRHRVLAGRRPPLTKAAG